jgi:hypothetical protein
MFIRHVSCQQHFDVKDFLATTNGNPPLNNIGRIFMENGTCIFRIPYLGLTVYVASKKTMIIEYLDLTYLLTPRSRVLLDKLTGL